MTKPLCSVAAVTYRDVRQTRTFIDSVYASTPEPFEFIMIDNGSPTDLSEFLQDVVKQHDNFQVVRHSSNLGIGVAMNRALKLCSTDYILRCDSDIQLISPGWFTSMRRYFDNFSDVGAVGTAITTGIHINNGRYVDTDICLSNCMMVHRRTFENISKKLFQELPRISSVIAKKIDEGQNRYDGYYTHLGSMLNEIYYDGGRWPRAFQYGADDLHFSMLIRYANMKIAVDDTVQVFHKDDSLRKEWKTERERVVNLGFQYWRTFWEVMLDFYDIPSLTWECWPLQEIHRKRAENVARGVVYGG